MWIVPKTLSAFVPDTEGLNLALDEQAWMLEQSAMWRSKPSSKQTWLRRLKKGGWITHLSGRILKPSLHQSFVEKYTDSLEDIHASPSVAQASDKEKKTQDTYGHTSSSTSGQLDLFGAFGKMSKDTPRWGYGESCPIWKKKVIERRGAYSQRKKLARHTKGNECSSLRNYPTPTSRDWKGKQANEYKDERGEENNMKFASLPGVVDKIAKKNWATPMAGTKDHMGSSVEYYQRRQRIGKQVDLNGQVILDKWATPQASDHVEGARTAKESNQKCLGRDLNQMNWGTPASNDANKTPHCEINSKQGGLSKSVGIEEAKIHNGLPAPEKSNTSGKNQGSWPTPRVGGHEKAETSIKRGRGVSLTGAVAKDATQTPKLNPNWVEQLMGLSVGWTQLPTEWTVSGSSEMESSAKPQN